MLKGLVVSSSDKKACKVKKSLDGLGMKADFKTAQRDEDSIFMIDTREVDMVIIDMNDQLKDAIEDRAVPFIKEMLESEKKFIPLKIEKSIRYINKDRILYIEVIGRDIFVHTISNSYRLHRYTMRQLLEDINDPFFIRCHKSYGINVKQIKDVYKERRLIWKPIFEKKSDAECLISETYYENVIRKHERWITLKEQTE